MSKVVAWVLAVVVVGIFTAQNRKLAGPTSPSAPGTVGRSEPVAPNSNPKYVVSEDVGSSYVEPESPPEPELQVVEEEQFDEIYLTDAEKLLGFEVITKVVSKVRMDQNVSSQSIARLRAGSVTRVISVDGDWAFVLVGQGGQGWIKLNQIALTEDGARALRAKADPPIADRPQPYIGRDYPSSRYESGYSQSSGGIYPGEGGGHWIDSVSDGGSIIKLEDGSIWRVDPTDVIDSALWLPTEEIIVRESSTSIGGYRLINTDNSETVGAKYLGR